MGKSLGTSQYFTRSIASNSWISRYQRDVGILISSYEMPELGNG